MGNTLAHCGCNNNEQSVVEAEQQTEAQLILQQQWSAYTLHNPDVNQEEKQINYESGYTEPTIKNADQFINQINSNHAGQESDREDQNEVQFAKPLLDFVQTPTIVTFKGSSESSVDQSMTSSAQHTSFDQSIRVDKKVPKSSLKQKRANQYDKKQNNFNKRSPSEIKKKSSTRKRALIEEKEIVLKEGELLKVCPGIARMTTKNKKDSISGSQFVTRWCQLTENKFRYYKSKINAYQTPEKPLLSIPLSEILSILKHKINKDEVQFEESPDRTIMAGHLIRVPLKDTQMSPLKGKQLNTSSRNNGMSRQFQTSICTEQNADKNHWSKREEDWYNLEEKLIFKNNINNMTDGDPDNILSWIKLINKQRVAKGPMETNQQTILTEARSMYSMYQSPNWARETSNNDL